MSTPTDTQTLEIVAVLGSVTPPGRLKRALEQALARADQNPRAHTTLVDLADVQIAQAAGRAPEQLGDDTAALVQTITSADVVLFAPPVYRGSLTGSLKNLLDQLPVESLEGKVCAAVTMGQAPQHYLGAERHLRDVLAFFGAVLAPVASYLTAADFLDGEPGPRASTELDELITTASELALALGG